MRHPIVVSLCIAGAFGLSACKKSTDAEVQRTIESVNVIEESNLSDIMLTAADPNEGVAYFQRAVGEKPESVALKRGLAKALVRAKKPTEAAIVWKQVIDSGEGTNEDRVGYADALIRGNDWKRAEAELNSIPPTYETFERYRLEAMVADANRNWKKADSFYETAIGLTTTPASTLNNWGFSKLTRGDFAGAEKLFAESITYDSSNFTAKNNLVMARAAQRQYDLPIVPMTQVERAQLLYTAALSAIKQGDVQTGKSLLNDAIETHPQYFEEATRALETLDSGKAG